MNTMAYAKLLFLCYMIRNILFAKRFQTTKNYPYIHQSEFGKELQTRCRSTILGNTQLRWISKEQAETEAQKYRITQKHFQLFDDERGRRQSAIN